MPGLQFVSPLVIVGSPFQVHASDTEFMFLEGTRETS